MWNNIAVFILRHRIVCLGVILIISGFFVTQIPHVRLSYKEANLLPDHDTIQSNYTFFKKTFQQENNLVVLGIQDSTIYQPKNIKRWDHLFEDIKNHEYVSLAFSFHDFQIIEKDTVQRKFKLKNISDSKFYHTHKTLNLKAKLLNFPFYQGLLYNNGATAVGMAVYLDPNVVDTKKRIDWVSFAMEKVRLFETDTGIDVKVSGMPVIRTMNVKTIMEELGLFVLLAMVITLSLFYFFFRSVTSTFISALVVGIAVVWSYSSIGAFGFQITIFTAIIPPLIIVIGVPNCIFLINKYQQEFASHGDKTKALTNAIASIGHSILLTNITTAFGFFTFLFTGSQYLQEFGAIASLNIMGVFLLAIVLIPILYSYLPEPMAKHLRHIQKQWVFNFLSSLENSITKKRKWVYFFTLCFFVFGIIGISKMYRSMNILDDLAKDREFYRDIEFFDQEFGGVLPVEMYIEGNRKKEVTSLSFLKKLEQLSDWMEGRSEFSSSVSLVNLIKFSKQAFYENDQNFYALPTNLDKNFILQYTKRSGAISDLLKSYADSTGSKTRISSLLKNIDREEMIEIFDSLDVKIKEIFPKEKYTTFITGASYLFYKGAGYFSNNIFISLGLAILFIALFISWMFRSPMMALLALLPNLLPLLVTAGIMGYFSISLKPSTILVFSVAFGISVDDTIHFLAKLRQDMKRKGNQLYPATLSALKETGLSMFYTSIVLFFGFFVFLFSGFGGTVALGGLVSVTLLVAMASNLILLPSLLLTFQSRLGGLSSDTKK